MESQRHTHWLHWLTTLAAGIGLAVGAAACEPADETYMGTETEATRDQQEEPAQQDQEEFGVFDDQEDQQQADPQQPAGQPAAGDQQQATGPTGQQQEGQQQQATGQTDQQQETAEHKREDIDLEGLEASDISDEDLSQFAELQNQLHQEREGEDQATGGGPIEDRELAEWETEMIQGAGMGVDRFLAIRTLLQEDEQLRQRYQDQVDQIGQQPDQQ